MKRLDRRTVLLTRKEEKAYEVFEAFLDEGDSLAFAAEKTAKRFSLSETFIEWLIYGAVDA